MLFERGAQFSALLIAGLLGVGRVADGAHVRVTSKSTPEGTHVTVNGKPVQPGEWSDEQGHGRFETGSGSSRVSYSSSSGSARGWTSSTTSGKGKHCSSVSVKTTKRNGKDSVVTTTTSDKCDDETVEEPSWVRDAGKTEEDGGHGRRGHFQRFGGAGFVPDMMLKDLGYDSDSGRPGEARRSEKEQDREEKKKERGNKKKDWEKTVESDGKGVDEDFGHGMRGSAHASGDTSKERVTAKTRYHTDGSVSRSVSASATATSSSHS